MSMSLTYWNDDGNIKTVKCINSTELATLICDKPRGCTIITTQHSFRTMKNGLKSNFRRIIWSKNNG